MQEPREQILKIVTPVDMKVKSNVAEVIAKTL